jgi:hypothetical protein
VTLEAKIELTPLSLFTNIEGDRRHAKTSIPLQIDFCSGSLRRLPLAFLKLPPNACKNFFSRIDPDRIQTAYSQMFARCLPRIDKIGGKGYKDGAV